jgi:2-polyprenyl-6-methoxyphenol hydroxylase-like FAD-dependent oxidoreductase
MQNIEVPYLVVGGGPVGMLAAILLAGQGRRSVVLERRSGPQTAPAAHVVNARSFEICRQAGLDMEATLRLAKDPADAGHVIFMTHLGGEELGRLPFERQGEDCLRYTPTPLRNLSQHRFEPILAAAIDGLEPAEIRYGHQWESSEQDAAGVTSSVRDLASGELTEIRSRFVIAADGAGSRVRKSLGIEMDGPPRLQSFLMIHVEANLRDLVRERPGVLYWMMDPEVGGVLVAHDIDREWVYMVDIDPDRESVEDYDDERCRSLVQRAIGRDLPLRILHRGSWTMSAQVAQRMRGRRIFLAGDAAHRFPPTGGLGLNTGFQDVHGLVWKLCAVEDSWAPESLLDGYESERLPVARHNAEQSLRNAVKLVQLPQALGTAEEPTTARMQATLADPAGRRAVQEAIAAQAEHFDMLGLQLGYVYTQGALVTDGSAPPELDNPVREYAPSGRPGARLPLARVPVVHVRVGDDAVDPDGGFAAVCGIEPGGALLVRPDQHVAWRAKSRPADPGAELGAALRTILGAPG